MFNKLELNVEYIGTKPDRKFITEGKNWRVFGNAQSKYFVEKEDAFSYASQCLQTFIEDHNNTSDDTDTKVKNEPKSKIKFV